MEERQWEREEEMRRGKGREWRERRKNEILLLLLLSLQDKRKSSSLYITA